MKQRIFKNFVHCYIGVIKTAGFKQANGQFKLFGRLILPMTEIALQLIINTRTTAEFIFSAKRTGYVKVSSASTLETRIKN
ncbi:MAG: hypothetical protein AMJ55_11420 [Gammaproteobacteria bacterium SG8_15]|nr:MAG: hypothetical protein AMJ55_11420 [Gammaproteobacteria bacterium SG8_15]